VELVPLPERRLLVFLVLLAVSLVPVILLLPSAPPSVSPWLVPADL